MRSILWVSLILAITYFNFWPTPVDPKRWDSPNNPGYIGAFRQNTLLEELEFFEIAGTHGPEGLALSDDGMVYASSGEGWILRHNPSTGVTEKWVNTGGRPLGIAFDQNSNLLVADAFLGLLSISPTKAASILANQINGSPIKYADDVDVGPDGRIYFSDASTKFGALEFGGTYEASLLDIIEHGEHGRILVHDPKTKTTSNLFDGLNFANGVAVDAEGRFLLVAETGSYRIIKYWLQGDRVGQREILIENLPGFPDNIVRGQNGRYWIGLVAPRDATLDALSRFPWLREIIQRLPRSIRPAIRKYSHVFAIDESGNIISSLQDPSGSYHSITGALELDDWLYVSSLLESKLGRLDLSQAGMFSHEEYP